MDEQLNCIDCRTSFNFTAGEQAFYAERGYQKPRRCKSCRAKRKATQTSSPSAPVSVPPTTEWVNEEPAFTKRPSRRRDFGKSYRRNDAY